MQEPKRPYIGLTHDVDARVAAHNAGRCAHTAGYRPWGLVAAIMLADEPTAIRFERYLKSGSGRAFSRRHFEPYVANPSTSAGEAETTGAAAHEGAEWEIRVRALLGRCAGHAARQHGLHAVEQAL